MCTDTRMGMCMNTYVDMGFDMSADRPTLMQLPSSAARLFITVRNLPLITFS